MAEVKIDGRSTRYAVISATEQQRELAAQYLPLAKSMALPYKQASSLLAHDYESAACWGVLRAAVKFDPSCGVDFATYATIVIRNELKRVWCYIRSRGQKYYEGGDIPVVTTLTSASEAHGRIPGRHVEAHEEAIIAGDALETLLNRVPERHANVCRLLYVNGMSQSEIADKLDMSQSNVSKLHRQALKSLKRQLSVA